MGDATKEQQAKNPLKKTEGSSTPGVADPAKGDRTRRRRRRQRTVDGITEEEKEKKPLQKQQEVRDLDVEQTNKVAPNG